MCSSIAWVFYLLVLRSLTVFSASYKVHMCTKATADNNYTDAVFRKHAALLTRPRLLTSGITTQLVLTTAVADDAYSVHTTLPPAAANTYASQ